MSNEYAFGFERLDVYRLSVGVARWMRSARWPTGSGHLKDQGTRAADSVVLNLAEGWGRRGKAGQNHFRIAKGSAGEALAVLQLAELSGSEESEQHLRRVGAMLEKLSRR